MYYVRERPSFCGLLCPECRNGNCVYTRRHAGLHGHSFYIEVVVNGVLKRLLVTHTWK